MNTPSFNWTATPEIETTLFINTEKCDCCGEKHQDVTDFQGYTLCDECLEDWMRTQDEN